MNISESLWQDKSRMSGAVCFRGTRIPVTILFDYLENGELDEFFRGYPDVTKEQVHSVIEASKELVTERFASGHSR
jgi:uncharacterized protein (DUF433 family)